MVHILLTILKIIGIILLVIIGLILLIVLCALFVPVRYQALISYQENQPYVKVKISYLLSILSLNGELKDKKLNKNIRIFGYKTKILGDEDAKEEYDSDSSDGADAPLKDGEDVFSEVRKKKRRKRQKKEKVITAPEEENDYLSVYETEEERQEEQPAEEQPEEQEIVHRYGKKIFGFFQKIKFKIKSLYDKIKGMIRKLVELKEKISSIKALIDDENNRELIAFLWMELKKVLKYIAPRKIKGYFHYGFEDPSLTGKSLGLIYVVLRGNVGDLEIQPDFEKKHLETEVRIKGRIRLYYLLIIALQVYKNNNFKVFLERRRTHGK